ncbi:MAG: PAS domain-containing protein [Dongiaceae bacterium]
MAEPATDLTRILDVVESAIDSSTVFESKKVRGLHDWWVGANGGRMPSRGQFDVIEHKRIVPNLFVVDVLQDSQFRFRLLGEDVIQIIGRNRKGELVKRSNPGEYGHELATYYESVVAERVCRKCTGFLIFATRGSRRFESIDCPLRDEGDERISTIVGVMDLIK